jgi:hypothetical protein
VVLGIGLLVLLAVYAYLSWPTPRTSGNPGQLPLSAVLALSNLRNTRVGPHDWYNTTVLGLGTSLELGRLTFTVRNASGGGPLNLPWMISAVVPGSANPSATYSIPGAVWTSGATMALTAGDVFSVDVGTAPVAGYSLVIGAEGNFGGTINLAFQ